MTTVLFWIGVAAIGLGVPFLLCRWAMKRLDIGLSTTVLRNRR